MVELGYALSSEEHGATALVELAARAEEIGFEFALISDHYHPWISKQGNSPFVWSVLGGIARATDSLRLGTGVTCPILRMHPAIVAQAAATTATMMPGRFFLGVGTGERLNEHVTGAPWPPFSTRLDMVEEAIGVIRTLWSGEEVSHHGDHFSVENAKLFTLPDDAPPVYLAASGETTAAAAGELADGLISTAPDATLVDEFGRAGDDSAPQIGQLTVCWADDEGSAINTAHEWWPNSALPGQVGQELPTPAHFEQACELVQESDIAEQFVCGPDIENHIDAIDEFVDAGFDHVYIHQIGPAQSAFFDAYEEDVLPVFE